MTQLTPDQKQKIKDTLERRNAIAPCPRCTQTNFILTDAYFNYPMQGDLKNPASNGTSIPAIGMICTNCGFISHHALGALGLLD
jgi:hypothetical protein